MRTRPSRLFITDPKCSDIPQNIYNYIQDLYMIIYVTKDNASYMNIRPVLTDLRLTDSYIEFTVNIVDNTGTIYKHDVVYSFNSDIRQVVELTVPEKFIIKMSVARPTNSDINIVTSRLSPEMYTYSILFTIESQDEVDNVIKLELPECVDYSITDKNLTLTMNTLEDVQIADDATICTINGVMPDEFGNLNIVTNTDGVEIHVRSS